MPIIHIEIYPECVINVLCKYYIVVRILIQVHHKGITLKLTKLRKKLIVISLLKIYKDILIRAYELVEDTALWLLWLLVKNEGQGAYQGEINMI